MTRPPPRSTLFPSPPLFRSQTTTPTGSPWPAGPAWPRAEGTARAASAWLPLGLLAHPVEHRSEEHTSELQSQSNLVCRLLLEKKKKLIIMQRYDHVNVTLCN